MALITTTKGMMETDLLWKRVGTVEDDNEKTNWVEYWLDGELIHRSVHVELKHNVAAEAIAASF